MHTEKSLKEAGRVFIEGTLVFVTPEVATKRPEIAKWLGKQVVQRKCEGCGALHFRATSDLHQTPNVAHALCDACGKKNKKARKAAEKAAQRNALAAKATDAPKGEVQVIAAEDVGSVEDLGTEDVDAPAEEEVEAAEPA